MPEKRVAIFQYEWGIESHTLNLIKGFEDRGYLVDLFIYDCFYVGDIAFRAKLNDEHFSQYGIRVDKTKIVDIYSCDDYFHVVLRKLLRKIQLAGLVCFEPIRRSVVKKCTLSTSEEYDFVIGIEKKGLLFANMVLPNHKIIYYSLELDYTGESLGLGGRCFQKLRLEEIAAHNKAWATIIQDPMRWKSIRLANHLTEDARRYYFPISAYESPSVPPTSLQKFGISDEKKLILYFGRITSDRFCLELASQASSLGDDFVVLLHGQISESFFKKLKDVDGYSSRFFISCKPLSRSEVESLIARAYIGIAFYRQNDDNHRLTAFSSEKVALYAKYGVPFLTFQTESYLALNALDKCCVCLMDMNELSDAILEIDKQYKIYKKAALNIFHRCFSFEKNFDSFFHDIEQAIMTSVMS